MEELAMYADSELADWRADPMSSDEARRLIYDYLEPQEYWNALTGFGQRVFVGLVHAATSEA